MTNKNNDGETLKVWPDLRKGTGAAVKFFTQGVRILWGHGFSSFFFFHSRHPSVADPVKSVSSPGSRRISHWVG